MNDSQYLVFMTLSDVLLVEVDYCLNKSESLFAPQMAGVTLESRRIAHLTPPVMSALPLVWPP